MATTLNDGRAAMGEAHSGLGSSPESGMNVKVVTGQAHEVREHGWRRAKVSGGLARPAGHGGGVGASLWLPDHDFNKRTERRRTYCLLHHIINHHHQPSPPTIASIVHRPPSRRNCPFSVSRRVRAGRAHALPELRAHGGFCITYSCSGEHINLRGFATVLGHPSK